MSLPAIFRRNVKENAVTETAAAAPLMRFLTHGGAEVHVAPDYSALCQGCDWASTHSSITFARERANAHAETCRAMPRPAA